MEKIFQKSILILMCILSISVFTSIATFAEYNPQDAITRMTEHADRADQTEAQGEVNEAAKSITSTVVTVVQTVGILLGIAMLIIFGIRWMTAQAAAKAKLKEEMWNYVIGAALLIGAPTIVSWIYSAVVAS